MTKFIFLRNDEATCGCLFLYRYSAGVLEYKSYDGYWNPSESSGKSLEVLVAQGLTVIPDSEIALLL
jgi:hypothetical protein